MIKEFQEVRNWKEIRGIGADNGLSLDKRLQSQFQRVQQEVSEVHEAIVLEDWDEFEDGLGDSIVTLINIASIKGLNAEDCLARAFNVIKYRKGLTRPTGDFVRYGKLSDEDKLICDEKQGNPGNQYFEESALEYLTPEHFKK
jgi:NTP pyrophosphatase (non-canonical NTP hydrolase)